MIKKGKWFLATARICMLQDSFIFWPPKTCEGGKLRSKEINATEPNRALNLLFSSISDKNSVKYH